jgi:hypothetical protein
VKTEPIGSSIAEEDLEIQDGDVANQHAIVEGQVSEHIDGNDSDDETAISDDEEP